MDAGIGAKATVLDCTRTPGPPSGREGEGMDAGIGAKATVLDCMVGDCEGICASLQA